MRNKLEIWLEALIEKYENLRVTYVLVFALLLIVIGSVACSSPQSEKPATTGGTTASPVATATPALPATVTNETKNPLTELAAAATAGKPIYEKNCAFCHGAAGASDGTFEPKPPRIDSGEVTKDPDGEIFLTIKNGKGKAMPAMKRLSDEEIWQVVAFVRSFAKK